MLDLYLLLTKVNNLVQFNIIGEGQLTDLTLFAATTSGPVTVEWSPKVAIVMIICNVIAIAFGKFTIKNLSEKPALPAPSFFGGMGLPALLGTTSFGHLLGAGAILGLARLGAL